MPEWRCIHGVPAGLALDVWRVSSYCASGGCVEARPVRHTVQIRDARRGPTLTVPAAAWRALTRRIATGGPS